jgi:hypothetical protein
MPMHSKAKVNAVIRKNLYITGCNLYFLMTNVNRLLLEVICEIHINAIAMISITGCRTD